MPVLYENIGTQVLTLDPDSGYESLHFFLRLKIIVFYSIPSSLLF